MNGENPWFSFLKMLLNSSKHYEQQHSLRTETTTQWSVMQVLSCKTYYVHALKYCISVPVRDKTINLPDLKELHQ